VTGELLLDVILPIVFGFLFLVFNKPLTHFFVGIEQRLGYTTRPNTIATTRITYVIIGGGAIAFGVYSARSHLY